METVKVSTEAVESVRSESTYVHRFPTAMGMREEETPTAGGAVVVLSSHAEKRRTEKKRTIEKYKVDGFEESRRMNSEILDPA